MPTTGGVLEGVEVDGVLQFRGVPYAASTAGAGRFRPPQPVEPWSGVRPAVEHGPVAPQPASILETIQGQSSSQDEDCLTLTVTTPSTEGRRPVMVWIHGGGYQTGSGSVPWYDGRRLAARGGVVVVSIAYRLGALGYLRLDHLLGEELATSANLGLLDQVAALRWVRDNIAAFGGDPDQVTLFGESAGAMSVATLLGTPAAAGLFHRAIPQSGAGHHVSTPDEAAEVTALLLGHLGLAERDAAALLDLPVDRILAAQALVAAEVLPRHWGLRLAFQPTVDGGVLPAHPLDAVRGGATRGIPLVTGTTADEWGLFHVRASASGPLAESKLVDRADRVFGGRGAEAVERYRRARPGATPDQIWVAIGTDLVFRVPAVRLADAHSAHEPDTWAYRFSHRSPALGGVMGACHAIDIPFVFDNVDVPGVDVFVGPPDEGVRQLAAVTAGAWLSFARHGDPGHEGLPSWPRYRADHRAVLDLGSRPELLVDPDGEVLELYGALR
ncbi:MAG: carboxylesterase/lipase family protein [Acidimicrobiia bacterium]